MSVWSSFIPLLTGGNSKKKNKEGEAEQPLPKTAQQSIPYIGVSENGIIQTGPRTYSKAYTLSDINFIIESSEEQEKIFGRLMEFLGSFGPEMRIQTFIYNKSINSIDFQQKVLLPLKNDNLNEYREEMNNMLIDKMAVARNNIIHEKQIIVSADSDDIETAKNIFSRIDSEVAKGGQRLTGTESKPIGAIDRLSTLYSIYNMDSTAPFYQKVKTITGKTIESFSFKNLKKLGLKTKDVIAPSCMDFERDYFRIGDKYGRALFLCDFPSFLRGDILTELANMPFNMLTTVHYRTLPQDQAIKKVKEQTTNINANVVDQQKKPLKAVILLILFLPK